MIAELNSTIQRQTARVNTMQLAVDSLAGANAKLGTELALLQTTHNKAYYVIGNEEDLLKKGIIVREGGAESVPRPPWATRSSRRGLSTRRSSRRSISAPCTRSGSRLDSAITRSCRGRASMTPTSQPATGPLPRQPEDQGWRSILVAVEVPDHSRALNR